MKKRKKRRKQLERIRLDAVLSFFKNEQFEDIDKAIMEVRVVYNRRPDVVPIEIIEKIIIRHLENFYYN